MPRVLLIGRRLLLPVLWLLFGSLEAQIAIPDSLESFTMRGTYYSDRFVGRKTSSGERFVQTAYTAAHHSFKFGTLLLVTNPKNGKQVIVRVNDRCPKRNVVDMTRKAARQIGVSSLPVRVQVLPDAFRPYWEAQDALVDILAEGRILDYARTHPAPISGSTLASSSASKDIDIQKGDTHGGEVQDSSSRTAAVNHPRFNIELCRCPSRNTASKRVSQLPIYYQDRVEYHTQTRGNVVVVTLNLAAGQEQADAALKEVKGLFPEAKLVTIK